MRRLVPLAFALLLLSACSTIIDGETQFITVETPGARESECILFNGDFNYIVHPPETINISRRRRALEITCKASGNRMKKETVIAKAPTSFYMNMTHGFAPGAWVDYESGAMNVYPEKVVIDFRGEKQRPYPYPDYHLEYYDNPAVAGLEEFRPGKASLLRDQYEAIPQMVKKETLGDDPVVNADIRAVMTPGGGTGAAGENAGAGGEEMSSSGKGGGFAGGVAPPPPPAGAMGEPEAGEGEK